MILTDEEIEIAMDELAKGLVARGMTAEQVGDRLRSEANRVEQELEDATH